MNMKKFTSLLTSCCLALAGAAFAQQPEEQQTPKGKQGAEKTHGAEAKPGANAAKPEATAAKQRGARNQRGASTEQSPQGTPATPKSERRAGKGKETNVSGEPAASATPGAKQEAGQQRGRGKNARGANAKTSPNVTPATAASPNATPVTAAAPSATPVTAATPNAAPTVAAATGQQNAPANAGAAVKKPDPQQVQQIKAQHTSFRAQPRPDRVPPVTFSQSYR